MHQYLHSKIIYIKVSDFPKKKLLKFFEAINLFVLPIIFASQ